MEIIIWKQSCINMHMIVSASTLCALWEKYFMTGYMLKQMKKHENPIMYIFLGPCFLTKPPRKIAWIKALSIPKVPNVKPIWKGPSLSPPNSKGVEYIRGTRAK